MIPDISVDASIHFHYDVLARKYIFIQWDLWNGLNDYRFICNELL